MYHYVRDPERTRFPRINARRIGEFEGQLDYLERHHRLVSLGDVCRAATNGASLPERACLLTFDDGLVDHVETVAGILRRRGLPACFCPPAGPVLERGLLDVQKSQFVLAASNDHSDLCSRILDLVRVERDEHDAPTEEDLRSRFAVAGRYDGAETILAKRLLQDALPESLCRPVLDQLFAELVSADEAAFADELYASREQLERLLDDGFELAGHGYHHRRLSLLDDTGLRTELDGSRRLLGELGAPLEGWAMCFAYGDRDGRALRVLRELGCSVGLTTDVGLAGPGTDPLQLPRLDTNDVPTDRDDAPSTWTREADG